MRCRRRAAPALLAALALSCGRASRDATPAEATPAAAPLRLSALPLAPGLVLALDPNLPGGGGGDVPEAARRGGGVRERGKEGLKLRWCGRARVEKPEAARRREEWVRAW